MIQHERGSGHWQRISWDTAIDIIARKILDLKTRFNSTLPLCLNKYSGNFGLLRNACEGMFNSLGPTTQTEEDLDIYTGYFQQWLDINERAIPPQGETKSDLEIARLRNQHGQLTGILRFDSHLPPDIILSYQSSSKHGTVNALNGVALYDVLVNIRRK